MATVQQLKEIGESLGLKGAELMSFIKEQQSLEREERERQREKEKGEREEQEKMRQYELDKREAERVLEIERAKKKDKEREEKEKEREEKDKEREEQEKMRQHELDMKDKERQIELEKRDKEIERMEREKQLEIAKKDKEMQMELEKRGRERQIEEERAKEKEKEREFMLERIEKEKEKAEELARMASAQESEKHQYMLEVMQKQKELQEQGLDVTEGTEKKDGIPKGKTAQFVTGKVPKMPYFDEERDFMDSYLGRFERFAMSQKWDRDHWALYLSALLKGRALDVYSMMPAEQANEYDKLKSALLKRYQLSADGFKKRFRTAKPEAGETPAQFLIRINNYLVRWIELAQAAKSYDGLRTLIVQEQYLSTCPKEMAMHLKEGKPKSITELAEIAENYVEAHATDIVFGFDPRMSRFRGAQSDTRRCFNCGKAGHQKHQCPGKTPADKPPSSPPKTPKTPYQKTQPQSQNSVPRCFRCNKLGHISRYCMAKQIAAMDVDQSDDASDENQEEAAGCQPQERTSSPDIRRKPLCRRHKKNNCPECFDLSTSTHHCQALIAICQDCGLQHPVIADACQSRDNSSRMPVTEGFVEGKPVNVLRDTGCSTVVVRRSLVPDDKLTGQEERCILMDGTIRRTPVAEIFVNTPYYSGPATAVCMKNPIYDLTIGNIPGARDATNPQEPLQSTQAVQTRSQAKAPRGLTPLVTPLIDFGSENVAQLQAEDESLHRALEAAEQKNDPQFKIQRGFLYRIKKNRQEQETKQLALPTKLRHRVMTLAHAGVMSGHQGVHRTHERVATSFWWPGMSSDVTRFCHSCDTCQRTISKGRVPRVPLGKMPVIDTPFKRVAIDLVGEIFPASSRGHRYILTVVDFATRYPEAVALKNISTITVAEALVSIFSRVGIPEEILSDQGTQFTSNLMKEVGRLLSIKQLTTTPYHPQCNGLVERFNGTLKTMLRRMCTEKPKDWDRYIDALLFAYREAPQESLGFAPFELIYGRSVNGPLQILRQLWTKEQSDPETRTTYQYVVDLRNRLQETWDMAHDELRRSQVRQKRQFDRRAKERTFKRGDLVLILLPTSDNKLLMQWKGPFQVVERVEGHDYRIQLLNKQKILHANLLKQYIPPETGIPEVSDEPLQVTSAAILEPIEDACDQGPELDTLNPLQKETVNDIRISPELSEAERADVQALLVEYKDIFTDVPSVTNAGEHVIQLTTAEPIKGKAYSLPHAMRETLDREIDNMLAMGVIEESQAAYSSPVVMVKKPDGSTRVCIDYRKLNSVTVFDPEPMPTAEEIFAKLAGDRYFSKFDLSKGYWQVPVREEDRDFTTFICHRGLFRFRVMPFGLVNAPATFSRLMRRVLRDSQGMDNYLDDVLAHTTDWTRHLSALRDFFERIRRANLTLRPSKCEIGEKTVSFLGHSLSEGVLLPRKETVDKILQAPPPRTLKQLRAFLGLASFYRKYVPNFAVIAAPLTDATKKGNPNEIVWDENRDRSFQELKKRISEPPILRLPDVSKPFILQTDASHLGIGAVLFQEDSAEEKRPVAFASRKLQPRESRYSTIERECLAIVWGIIKFQEYLYGSEFILETDHQPLQYLREAKFQNGRLMRWALTLQPYRFLLRAIRGRDNIGADCLSRNPLDDEDLVVSS